MKTIITAWDIEDARSNGKNEIIVEDAIITEMAKDLAEKLGMKIITRGSGEKPNERYSGSEINIREHADFSHKTLRITEEDAEKWKEEFPILKDIIHVGNCSQGPQAKRVRKAIERYLDNWLTVGMDWDYWVQESIKAKEEFAKLINADPSEIAISTSVSEATASVASSLNPHLNKKKIVTTEADFPTIGHIWLAYQKYGYKVDFVPVKNGEIDLNDYEKYIDEDTILTSVTHVYYQNGFRQDIEKIADIAHRRGSMIYVDAYQSLGTVKIDVKKMNIDMLSSGNLKYLLGIPGIAFLYVSKDIIPYLKPAVTGWFGQENPFSFQIRYLDYAGDARRFDTGTPPVLTSFAARAGMEIINEVGTENIQERIEALSAHTINAALSRGLEVVSPRDPKRKGATTSIKVDDPHKVEELLKENRIIASARGDVIRIAPHFFTEKKDLETVMDVLKRIIHK
ncbi:aminotransferase class V-fold PLP-dependent enzyme [Thermoanaerobacteraceae bacterium SP2]|nr:aminotransferase class V-fold PLP-dependent enzyme [Thermoanaerobacteraceae bacterium SP2]